MSEKLDKINQQIQKAEAQLRRAKHEEKILEHQAKELTRKGRTHQLCTRGAELERYLPHPEQITDEQVSMILRLVFHRSENRQIVEQVLAKKPESE